MIILRKILNAFRELAEAESLAAANKRISNILKKTDEKIPARVDDKLLQDEAEQALAAQLNSLSDHIAPLVAERNYTAILHQLANLRSNVDSVFDKVMVMANDKALRHNRLALLTQLRNLFLQVADISQLQSTS
ncbi:MAG: DALR anticodon-binding domain-containing protein [Gammaproteobacteria bacterium]